MKERGKGQTLYDYKDRLPAIQRLEQLGWSDDNLRQVPVHTEQTAGEPFISVPIDDPQLKRSIRGLYIYKSDVSNDIWTDLINLIKSGKVSGYEQAGMYSKKGQPRGVRGEY